MKWSVEIENDRISFRSPYHPDLPTSLKATLPSRCIWNPKEKTWSLPLLWETCTGLRQLAKKFRAKLEIGPALMVWAKVVKESRGLIPSVDSLDVLPMTRLSEEYPHTAECLKMRGFQTVGATFMARNKSALLADDPGLGKTIQTISAVVESGVTGPILVVAAPKSAAVLTWPTELKKWAPGDKIVLISGAMNAREREQAIKDAHTGFGPGSNRQDRLWVITYPEYVRFSAKLDERGNYVKQGGQKIITPGSFAVPQFLDMEWSSIIVDEAHKTLAGVTSMNKKKWSQQRIGLDLMRVKTNGLRLALTGTPFRGKEVNVWGILNFLRPDLYNAGWKWIERHFVVYDSLDGKVIGEMIDEAAFYKELSQVMIRRTKAEVVPELPPKVYGGSRLDEDDPTSPVAVWLPMDSKQQKQYNAMKKSATVYLDDGELSANGVLAELTRLKQFACSAGSLVDGEFRPVLPSNKFDWLVDFLDERGIDKKMLALDTSLPNPRGHRADVGKVIVASQFTKLLNVFRDELAKKGIPVHILTGETKEADRLAAQEDWQNNPYSSKRVFLINTIAGGASITLDAADDVVLLDQTWNMDDQIQVEDRAHRISRTDHTVTIWNLLSLGTIEERIATTVTRKDRDIKSIIDGQRGVEFVQHILGKA